MIHPTALISPDATLGTNVRIGPYAVIESGAQIGDDCVIGAHVVISGFVSMGPQNVIHSGAVLGADPQDLRFDTSTPSRVLIGKNNQIREHCTIHRASIRNGQTRIGDHCFLMAGSHVGHDSEMGTGVILANGSMLGGHTRIGDGVFLGGGCAVHQFVRLGRLVICQGNSAITKSLPPFTMAAGINGLTGLNVIGLRRAGVSSSGRASIKAAFDLVFRRGFNVSQALQEAIHHPWEAEAFEFLTFIRDPGTRGLCGLASRSAKADDDSRA